MTIQTDSYHALKCDAQIDNLLHPRCETISAGGFNDKTAVLESALKIGWTENGSRHMCPDHSKVSGIVLPPKAERKPRTPKPTDAGIEIQPS